MVEPEKPSGERFEELVYVCDIRIVGPNSELARACPPHINAQGYIVNDIPADLAYRPGR